MATNKPPFDLRSEPSGLKTSKRVSIISYLDYPMPAGISRRISGTVASLRAANIEVEVVSPIFRTRKGAVSDSTRVDMRFLRAFGAERLPTKVLALLLFNLFAFVRILLSQKTSWQSSTKMSIVIQQLFWQRYSVLDALA